MRWLTAVENMNTPALKRELRQQRISFCLALFNVSTFAAWTNVRAYFAFINDRYSDRIFVGRTLVLLPIWGLCWFIGFIMVAQSVSRSRRTTWYGIVALAVDAVPLIAVAICVVSTFWDFFASI